jgi:2-polyprenyl-3-methyl-5-hydroxy-6-metoxy-1,4-benzoquinol methylase
MPDAGRPTLGQALVPFITKCKERWPLSEQPVSPNPDSVYSLFTGVYKPQLARIALTLDVFTPLASGPADAQAVAQACACSPAGIELLLDYLSSIGVLERHGNNYALTPSAATFLVPHRQSYAGDLLLQRTSAETVEGYLGALRSGKPYDPKRPWAQEAWLQSYGSPQSALEMWRLAELEPGPTNRLRIVDLACGCAIKSLALAQANPTVQIDCVDSSEVLEVARDLASRLGILSQVDFLPGELFTLDLEEGPYDAALLGQITHYFTAEENVALFRRVHESLVATGVLVIDAPMTLDRSDERSSFGSFFLWATSGGKAHSFAEYSRWLEAAGFTGVRQLGTEWLAARKASMGK